MCVANQRSPTWVSAGWGHVFSHLGRRKRPEPGLNWDLHCPFSSSALSLAHFSPDLDPVLFLHYVNCFLDWKQSVFISAL